MHSLVTLVAAAAAAAAPAPQAKVSAGSQLVGAVQNCRGIADNAARLACYDRSVGALADANARGDVQVVDRSQMREVRRSLFGFSVPKLPFFSGSKDKDVQEEPKELVSKLAAFKDIGNGFFRFALQEPASTWESTEASNVFDTRPGDKVTIKSGSLGSYFVQIGDSSWVRAKRIR
jgi:hypothetical protein